MPVHAQSSPNGRPPAFFVGDHLALDFLNTTAAPKGVPIEWIGSGRDLVDWLAEAGAIEPLEGKRAMANWKPADLDAVAQEAVALREWFRSVVTRLKEHGRGALSLDDIEKLNELLSLDVTVRRFEPTGCKEKYRVSVRRNWTQPRDLLAPIAAAMAELVADGDFGLIRQCENTLCTLWFYDRTKGHRRRWCSPAVCGNRAKVAAFRLRRRLRR